MELASHPLVCGQAKRTGLFWFTISPLLTDGNAYLDHPEIIFDRIWAMPDRTKHALGDAEN